MKKFAALLLVALVGFGVTPAQAADPVVTQLDVTAQLEKDGSLQVAETFTFDTTPATFEQMLATKMADVGKSDFHYTIKDVSAAAGDAPLTVEPRVTEDTFGIAVPTGGTSEPITIRYTVIGAAQMLNNGDTLVSWDVVQGLPYAVASVDATVSASSQFNMVDCAAGDVEHPQACVYYGGGTHDDPIPFFHHEQLAPGQVLRAILSFPNGAVTPNAELIERWSLDRAFSFGPLQLALVAGLLLIGGLAIFLVHRRFGRDAAGTQPIQVAEFAPVAAGVNEFRVLDAIRPGLVGTVMDERVDPVDVAATLVDLAVRKHLLIEELPRVGHTPPDWTFTRLDGADELVDFERTLLDAVAPVDGTPARVSELGPRIGAVIGQVSAQLYGEVVRRGWFRSNPHATRQRWRRGAVALLGLGVIGTVLLVLFTSFALVGLAFLLLVGVSIVVAGEMPSRTSAGVGLVSGLQLLRDRLFIEPVERLPEPTRVEQVSSILPYALVLGGYQRWVAAIVATDVDDAPDPNAVYWYHAPADWHLAYLPDSLHTFVVTVLGTLFARV
ncbi:MAG: DUF2207 domain-containing protein [Propionibacteriaceae bacterium]|jgi:hypothetical protein|nr:DUF2207 domain-containing protein [Propionibacteriaceae bacterium]